MLSPASHHRHVPRGVTENLARRRHVLRECEESAAARSALRQACRDDLLAYVNLFVWTYDPRKPVASRVAPFVTWDYQEKALRRFLWCYENRKDLVVEKSRDAGATWLFLVFSDWLCRFHPYEQHLMVSKSEKAVDFASPDSLFWKLDFVHAHLPRWLRGRRERKKMYIRHRGTNSVVTGEASTGRAGVGGRAGLAFIDEFSQIREGFQVLDRTADTCDCRFFNGTHVGTDNALHHLCHDPGSTIQKLRMHWTEHPRKNPGLYRSDAGSNRAVVLDESYHYPPEFAFDRTGLPAGGFAPGVRSPWYDEEVRRRNNARAVSMDLDIDPRGATSQVFDPLVVAALRGEFCTQPYWRGRVLYDPEDGQYLGLERDPVGPLKLWLTPTPEGTLPADDYGAAADVSQGRGATPSCWHAMNSRGQKVAEYTNNLIDPKAFGTVCVALNRMAKNAKFVWEDNGPGGTTGARVMELGYTNIYYRCDQKSVSKEPDYNKPGWWASTETKNLVFQEYYDALKSRLFQNPSDEAMAETLEMKFNAQGDIVHGSEVNPQKPESSGKNHGDLVITDALLWMVSKPLQKSRKSEEPADTTPGTLAWRMKFHEDRRRELAGGWED